VVEHEQDDTEEEIMSRGEDETRDEEPLDEGGLRALAASSARR
jgi:hypothetical protein